MNPFISITELEDTKDYILLLCKEENSSTIFCIPGSLLFNVPSTASEFIIKIQKVSIDESKQIICYDKGDLGLSGKVFWGLKAAGFENVRILLGGAYLYNDLGYSVCYDSIAEISLAEDDYLPFNNSILKISTNTRKKESYNQIIRADEDFPFTTPRGQIFSKEVIRETLNNRGIKYKPGKPIQVRGRFCMILASILLYMGENHVSIALDPKDDLCSFRTAKSTPHFDENSEDMSKAYSAYRLSESTNETTFKTPQSRKAGTICGNCLIA